MIKTLNKPGIKKNSYHTKESATTTKHYSDEKLNSFIPTIRNKPGISIVTNSIQKNFY